MLFTDLPDSILEDVAFHFFTATFPGPPPVSDFLLISKRINCTLNLWNRPTLFARVFRADFDYGAPLRRRLFQNAQDEAIELATRFVCLKRLKRGVASYPRYVYNDDVRDGGLRFDLWMAFKMLLENDGKNGRQLVEYAGLDQFALEWVRLFGRMHDGREQNGGWVLENELNCLGMWLFWLTDKDRVPNESLEQRGEIITCLSGIYAGHFKYLHQTHLTLNRYDISPSTPPPPPPIFAHHPPVFSPNRYYHAPLCFIPFKREDVLFLSCPLLTPPANLSFMCREEHAARLVPNLISPNIPMTREEARERGYPETSPVGEDYIEARNTIKLKCVDWRGIEGKEASRGFDAEWTRLQGCWIGMSRGLLIGPGMPRGSYRLGTLSRSLWAGQWKHVPTGQYEYLRELAVRRQAVPLDFTTSDYASAYMKLRIQEHFCVSKEPNVRLPFIDTDHSQLNAWFPEGTTLHPQGNRLIVRCVNQAFYPTYHYSTYNPQAPMMEEDDEDGNDNSPFGHNIHDILITAKTDEAFGHKWNKDETFIGRIRPWDQLVVLIRDLPEKTVGRWIFMGYLHSDGLLVGRWRETGTSARSVGWGGTYYLQPVSEA